MKGKLDYVMSVIYIATWIVLVYAYSGGPR